MSDNIIPSGNCIREKTTQGIKIIILTVQGSAITREIIFKIRRRFVTHNLMYL